MSIQKTSKEPTQLEGRVTVVITQNLRNLGTRPFQVNLNDYQVGFVPTRIVLRQISYVNTIVPVTNALGTEQGIFTLYSSFARQRMAFVTCGPLYLVTELGSVFNLPSYNPILEFQVLPTEAAVQGALPTTLVTQPTGLIAMTLEVF